MASECWGSQTILIRGNRSNSKKVSITQSQSLDTGGVVSRGRSASLSGLGGNEDLLTMDALETNFELGQRVRELLTEKQLGKKHRTLQEPLTVVRPISSTPCYTIISVDPFSSGPGAPEIALFPTPLPCVKQNWKGPPLSGMKGGA